MVEDPPVNAGDMGPIPALEDSTIYGATKVTKATTTEPVL